MGADGPVPRSRIPACEDPICVQTSDCAPAAQSAHSRKGVLTSCMSDHAFATSGVEAMAESEGDFGAKLAMVGCILFGLLAVLVCRYCVNALKANALAVQLRRCRPSRTIPKIDLSVEIMGALSAAILVAPICGVFVFLMISCESHFNAAIPPPNWADLLEFVGFLLWPLCSYFYIWPKNRYASNLRKALGGAVSLANGGVGLRRFALYLRSVTGDRRTIYTQTGPDGQTGDVHVQPAVLELKSRFGNRLDIYALWDAERDARPTLNFLPILSSDEDWKDDVMALGKRAMFIAADFEADKHGTLSQGVTWEIEFLMANPDLLGKTLAIVSADDHASAELEELVSRARWKVQVHRRDDYGSSFREMPEELLELVSRTLDA